MEIKIVKWRVSEQFRLVFLLLFFLLTGCAASDVSRNSANRLDATYNGVASFFSNSQSVEPESAYRNANQTTKGVWLGGTGGAVLGATSGIGVVPGAIEGAILGGALGAYIDAHASLVDKLQNRDVKVVVLGDQVLILLRSSQVFNAMTPTIRPYAYSTLSMVSQLIGNYRNMSVKVAAYTNPQGLAQVNLALSREQATSVAKYLWSQGVNTRLLYAMGYGGTKLVESGCRDWESGENYRIEITLEKLPV